MPAIFITGIDTGIGKSIAAGLMARYLLDKGKSVITMKLAETGGSGISEDIRLHRKIMGIPLSGDDLRGLTSPYVLKFPASPHLSARMENIEIDPANLSGAEEELKGRYDFLLIEGAGGIYVPLNDKIAIIDYIEMRGFPVIITTSARLGSINHTLMTIEICRMRKIKVIGLIYNGYPGGGKEISDDSMNVFRRYLKKWGIEAPVIEIPEINLGLIPPVDFSGIF